RVQQLEQPLERGERRRLHVGLIQPRLDRLEVPVAEVVEGQVVEPLDGVREVERIQVLLDAGPGCVDAREDPALLERRRTRLDLLAAVQQEEAARVPELVREAPALLDRAA